jgi:hypothetical protein
MNIISIESLVTMVYQYSGIKALFPDETDLTGE